MMPIAKSGRQLSHVFGVVKQGERFSAVQLGAAVQFTTLIVEPTLFMTCDKSFTLPVDWN
jgi:hypothetical protein